MYILGAYFELSDSDGVYNCKLSSDHFEIIITGGTGNHPSLFMSSIMEIKSIAGHASDGKWVCECPCSIIAMMSLFAGGSNKMTALQLTYKSDDDDTESSVILSPSPSHSRKQSIDWLKGLRKVANRFDSHTIINRLITGADDYSLEGEKQFVSYRVKLDIKPYNNYSFFHGHHVLFAFYPLRVCIDVFNILWAWSLANHTFSRVVIRKMVSLYSKNFRDFFYIVFFVGERQKAQEICSNEKDALCPRCQSVGQNSCH